MLYLVSIMWWLFYLYFFISVTECPRLIVCWNRLLNGAVLEAQTVGNLPAMREAQVWFLGWEDLLEKGMATTPAFLPGKSHGPKEPDSL